MKKERKDINDEDLNEEEKENQWWGFKWRRREEINDEDLNEEEKENQWWGFKWRRKERKSMMRI